MKKIFLISFPRSGSTLLQRLLMTNTKIISSNEPWFLLWLFSYNKEDLLVAKYKHRGLVSAMKQNEINYMSDKDSFKKNLKNFANQYYESLSNDTEAYFLDKTPNYIFILEDIIRTFENSKFIFLSRNPLAIAASTSNAWSQNRIQFSQYHYLFKDGFKIFSETIRENENKIHLINYEKLTENPQYELSKIQSYLDLNDLFNVDMLQKSTLQGSMGDMGLKKTFDKNEIKRNDSWIKFYNSVYRRAWAKSFLKKIGKENLITMGYNYDDLISKMNRNKSYRLISFQDIYGFILFLMYEFVRKVRFREIFSSYNSENK